MELERALSDLEEVRDRLARVQRFEGYSAPAAAVSAFARSLPASRSCASHLIRDAGRVARVRRHLALVFGRRARLNYGAVAAWSSSVAVPRKASFAPRRARSRRALRSAARSA